MRQVEATKPEVYYRWKDKMPWGLEDIYSRDVAADARGWEGTMSLVSGAKVNRLWLDPGQLS